MFNWLGQQFQLSQGAAQFPWASAEGGHCSPKCGNVTLKAADKPAQKPSGTWTLLASMKQSVIWDVLTQESGPAAVALC